MRVWKLAVLFFGCAACADVDSVPEKDAAGEEQDSGSSGDAGPVEDGGVLTDAGSEDAGFVRDSGEIGDWVQLDSEEIATEEAAEQIAELECGAPAICGGNPIGTWHVDSLCVTNALDIATQSLQNCRGILAAYERTASGTIAFDEEGAMEVDFTITGKQHLVLDEACLQHLYRKPASAEVCATYEEQLEGGGSGSASRTVSCAFEDGACRCDVQSESSLLYSGTYSVEGATIDDGATFVPFCAQDDRLMMIYGAGVRSTALTFTREADPDNDAGL